MGSVQQRPPFVEFVTLMAFMTAIVAMSIDTMLPALPIIGQDLGVTNPNESQLIISYLLLGLGIGQLIFGPISDSIGRRPAIFVGMGLFIIGCLLSVFATTMSWMLVGRLLQGFGIAGPRSVSMALIRDQFSGEPMARVMSYITSVFMLIPIVAPALGQGILLVASWRAIFLLFIVLTVIVFAWFAWRQPETLRPDNRIPFRFARLRAGFVTVVSNRIAFGYTLGAGLLSGAFIGYLNSAQQIFQDTYQVGLQFPLYFAGLAIALGLAAYLNAWLVLRFGMLWLTHRFTWFLTLCSLAFLFWAIWQNGVPQLWLTMVFLTTVFISYGVIFGNINSIAMEPLGQVAGVGAAIVGAGATLISTPLGTWVGQAYNGTIIPLTSGFFFMGVLTIGVMMWAERGRPQEEIGTPISSN